MQLRNGIYPDVKYCDLLTGGWFNHGWSTLLQKLAECDDLDLSRIMVNTGVASTTSTRAFLSFVIHPQLPSTVPPTSPPTQ